MDHDTQFDRSCAALIGMAIGDALGMPSQTLTRQEIQAALRHDHRVYRAF